MKLCFGFNMRTDQLAQDCNLKQQCERSSDFGQYELNGVLLHWQISFPVENIQQRRSTWYGRLETGGFQVELFFPDLKETDNYLAYRFVKTTVVDWPIQMGSFWV